MYSYPSRALNLVWQTCLVWGFHFFGARLPLNEVLGLILIVRWIESNQAPTSHLRMFAFSTTPGSGNNCCVLDSLGVRLWDIYYHIAFLLGGALSTPVEERGKKPDWVKREAELQSRSTEPYIDSQGTLQLRWVFRIFQVGWMDWTFTLTLAPIIDCKLFLERGMTLDKSVFFSWDNTQRELTV